MTKRSDVFQAAYDEGYAAEQDRIREIFAAGRKVGNSALAEYLAFDTRMTPAEAKAVIEVSIVSQETGDMERGRSGAEAYAQRRAADSVIGTREVAAQDVDRILRHSASNRLLGSAAAAAHGWKKAVSSINARNGHDVQGEVQKGKLGRN